MLTLGCKLNQADSARVAGRIRSRCEEARRPEEADLILLNTCTVTHKADREARQALRSLRRRNPHALLAVMGCSARRDQGPYRAMPEVDEVLATDQDLAAFLDGVAGSEGGRGHACVPHFGDRTRAFLKIQEGCNFPCAYCIIPSVRGPSRSVPVEVVVEDFQALLDVGYREVVLTGVNTGEYGKDTAFRGGLVGLVERLLAVPGRFRIRLNSLEPRAVTPGIRSLMRREAALAKHLQVPLQSGSDPVLSAMRRNYRAAFYEEQLRALAEEVPGVGIGADVLVGFPTESPADFDATLALLERSPVAFVHAFTYSPRPGTAAAVMPCIPQREAAERTRRVRALGELKSLAFAARFLGRPLPALTLAPASDRGRALTENFLHVGLPRPEEPNRFVTVTLRSAGSEGLTAQLVEA
ncbi:MAG: MiaB/RimO family radical SAM methylthiotransferase [Acidobacteriota bacterium]